MDNQTTYIIPFSGTPNNQKICSGVIFVPFFRRKL
nr:MAG TPA: hypothetical protein [Caudoviricetes sp.]